MSKPATTIDLAAFKKQLADSLERSAKSAGQIIVKESLTCEIATGLQVVTAPFTGISCRPRKKSPPGSTCYMRIYRSRANAQYRRVITVSAWRFRDMRRRVMSKSRSSTQKGKVFTH